MKKRQRKLKQSLMKNKRTKRMRKKMISQTNKEPKNNRLKYLKRQIKMKLRKS